jgi:hypothetical protein
MKRVIVILLNQKQFDTFRPLLLQMHKRELLEFTEIPLINVGVVPRRNYPLR